MIFHKSRSVFYDFLQISERLPGLILNRGAKSQMLRASEIFWSVCGISGTKKIPQKISNMQTLPFPKPAHFQWTQDQGGMDGNQCGHLLNEHRSAVLNWGSAKVALGVVRRVTLE